MLLKQLDGTHVRTVDGEQWRSSRSRQAVIEQLTVTRRAWVSSNCKSEPVRITQHPSHYGKTIRGGTQKVRPASWPAMHERHTFVCLSGFTLLQKSMCMRSKTWLAASVWLRLARLPPPASRVRRSRRLRDTLAAASGLLARASVTEAVNFSLMGPKLR